MDAVRVQRKGGIEQIANGSLPADAVISKRRLEFEVSAPHVRSHGQKRPFGVDGGAHQVGRMPRKAKCLLLKICAAGSIL
jgi:hypothetical protein